MRGLRGVDARPVAVERGGRRTRRLIVPVGWRVDLDLPIWAAAVERVAALLVLSARVFGDDDFGPAGVQVG
jgi:hypothetical protein